jgi:type II secretory ATPase GspE/PulE/Tfp pilus assembly ATPase PilB-like protein
LNRGFSIYGSQTAGDFKKIIDENVQESLRNRTKSAEEAAADLPIVAIVDNLLSYAISSRASDIHIEALEEDTLIRYRVDGILYEMMRIPKSVHPAITARLKLLSGLKIDEHYKPQDGRFRFQIVNQVVDIRVSVLPTYFGEKIVMRILESSQKPLSLDELGLLPAESKIVGENIAKTYGMVLVCGPTGSGKSTTLYAVINILNKPSVNIVTIEDPVEYNMRYINQSQINTQAGITFASGLRSILRQDPNIIMVGEIRDGETANISVQAALTGHLLLSTLHTNDAATAIPRLFDLEVPPFLVSSVLNLIIAQRLVRKICTSCVQSYPVDEALSKIVSNQKEDLGLENVKVPSLFFRGRGCPACGNTGYRGRLGIFEVLNIDDRIKKLIIDPNFSLDLLRHAARENGMKTMFEDGLQKAQLGLTTIEEVLRVIRE